MVLNDQRSQHGETAQRAHVLIYNSVFIPPDALKSHLSKISSVSNWVDIGLINVLFVQTRLSTMELVAAVRAQYRHPTAHVVAVEVAGLWAGQAPQALWDMLREASADATAVAVQQALDALHPPA